MLIYKGAEADIIKKRYLGFEVVEKKRIKKKYRIKEIDKKIRKQRTKQEANMLVKTKEIIKTPTIFDVDLQKTKITMEYIKGIKAKDLFSKGKKLSLMQKIGKKIKKMHDKNIIHGDLTTSNIIIKENEIYFIDFGLSFNSNKIEDKAVDLLNFKKMLKATHFKYFNKLWKDFEKNYADKKELEKINEIEKRARYAWKIKWERFINNLI